MLFKKTQLLVFLFTIIFSSFTFSQTTCTDTPWTKALAFSGGDYAKQSASSAALNPLRMGDRASYVALNSNSTKTSSQSYARPWVTAVVFQMQGGSNFRIWEQGEGTATDNDNMYLEVDNTRNLRFGWGREGGGYNEVELDGYLANGWYGVYICHKGFRPNSSNEASAGNLSLGFDIRVMSGDFSSGVGQNLAALTSNWKQTGYRMDRKIAGDFHVGSRYSNFNGKVASMVTATLRLSQTIPTEAEIEMMIKDPMKWLQDYRVGTNIRQPDSNVNSVYSASSQYSGYSATQVWLMGDGSSDSYTGGIKNNVYTGDSNTKLMMWNMSSWDISSNDNHHYNKNGYFHL